MKYEKELNKVLDELFKDEEGVSPQLLAMVKNVLIPIARREFPSYIERGIENGVSVEESIKHLIDTMKLSDALRASGQNDKLDDPMFN